MDARCGTRISPMPAGPHGRPVRQRQPGTPRRPPGTPTATTALPTPPAPPDQTAAWTLHPLRPLWKICPGIPAPQISGKRGQPGRRAVSTRGQLPAWRPRDGQMASSDLDCSRRRAVQKAASAHTSVCSNTAMLTLRELRARPDADATYPVPPWLAHGRSERRCTQDRTWLSALRPPSSQESAQCG